MRNFSILPYCKLRGKLRIITVTLPALRTLETTLGDVCMTVLCNITSL